MNGMCFKYLSSILLSGPLLLPTNVSTIMLEVPLFKWCSINLNNCTLDQCLCTNKFIVWGIVNHIKDTSLACDCLTTPWIVSSVQPQCPPLHITTTHTNSSDCLVTGNLGISWLTSKLVPLHNKKKISKLEQTQHVQPQILVCVIGLQQHIFF